ncbi:MAG TPA: hypothetical protein VMH35_13710 [Streptosporangiaceae bacterium]|nr:hypothetical protein [Streptosporangiaceae bacterium]
MRAFVAGLGAAALLMLAGCATGTPSAGPSAPAPTSSAHPATRARSSSRQPPGRAPRPGVLVSAYRAADRTVVTLARFTGPVRYRLHCGSSDPGPAALAVVRAGPAIGRAEHRRLIAAFNGGFLLSAGAGGYEQEGQVISPLKPGLASLVIDRSGLARIGVWGAGLPRPHEAVYSVRQNLPPLVSHGQPSPAAGHWGQWGATLGGGEYVARSALGENAAGQLIYAGSMSTAPADLAAALVRAGARTAMELDINPEWVQLDFTSGRHRHLRAVIPGQVRPASQYLAGWTRDFITVLAS